MKNLFKLFIVFVCCTAAMSLTSCLSSDEDSSITAEQQKSYQTSMAGTYYCKARFYKTQTTNGVSSTVKYDSLSYVGVTLKTDSTFTVASPEFVNCLDSAVVVTESDTKYQKLFEAMRDYDGTPTITGAYYIPYSSWVQNSYLYFAGSYGLSFTVNYDGADHYVYIPFAQTTTYGGLWTTTRALEIVQYVYGIYVSDTPIENATSLTKYAIESSYVRNIVVNLCTK